MEFFDTPVSDYAKKYVLQCLDSGRLSEGNWVRTFEMALEKNFGMRNVVAVNSGTSALHLALVLAGVEQGDEVILPAQTFVATGLAVLYCGAKPVFADIGMDGNISLEDLDKKITDRTRAIIAVSWGGNPCELRSLYEYCEQSGTVLVQDNAHALGSTYEDMDLSHFGDYNCYSFQAIKSLSTGDGGALTCRMEWDAEKARRLRWFGIDRERDVVDETGERNYNLCEVGYKYHMNNVAAAIGLGNLHGFAVRQRRVKEIAKIYNEELYTHIPTRRMNKKEGCSYWLYDTVIERRSDFMKAMRSRGVPVSIVHKGIVGKNKDGSDRNPVFGWKGELPVQEFWDEHHVCLPIHSGLTDDDVEKVVSSVQQGW